MSASPDYRNGSGRNAEDRRVSRFSLTTSCSSSKMTLSFPNAFRTLGAESVGHRMIEAEMIELLIADLAAEPFPRQLKKDVEFILAILVICFSFTFTLYWYSY